jgi:hypothetical protein
MTGTRWASRLKGAAVQPPPEELVSQMTQQTTRIVETRVPAEESRPEPSTTTGAGEPVAAQAEEEC